MIGRSDLDDLKEAMLGYESHVLSLDELKATILATADRVTEHDRTALRQRLLWTEGRLDVIQYTTDTHKIYATTLPVLEELKKKIEQSEQPTGAG